MNLDDIIAQATSSVKKTEQVPEPIIQPVNEVNNDDDHLPIGDDGLIVDRTEKVTILPDVRCGKDFVPEDDECCHLCETENCGNFWSHGARAQCRFPDLLSQGLCPECLGVGRQLQAPTVADDFKENKWSPRAQVQIRNDARAKIKNMTQEQLRDHILFLQAKIEEYRLHQFESRSKIKEIEEEELYALPEHERAAYIQAQRQGLKKKEKKEPKLTKKEQEEQKIRDLARTLKVADGYDAKLIASWMVKTGKTQAQMEAYLYDRGL